MSSERSFQAAKRDARRRHDPGKRRAPKCGNSNHMAEVRSASIVRKTNETDIKITLCLDEDPNVAQSININTGIGFLDHVPIIVQTLSSSSEAD
jgi:hypothetical protein